MSLGKLIQKGRQDKGMTQKELATKICEKPQIVNEYEQGKGIPNNQIMIKIEKAIGIKLRGKDKGEFLIINSITEHGYYKFLKSKKFLRILKNWILLSRKKVFNDFSDFKNLYYAYN